MAATIYEYVLGDINTNISGGILEGRIYKIFFTVGISKKKITLQENTETYVEWLSISETEISGAYLDVYEGGLHHPGFPIELSRIIVNGLILGFYGVIELSFTGQKELLFIVDVIDPAYKKIAQKTYGVTVMPSINFLEMKQLIDIASAEDTNMHILIEEYTPDNKLLRARMKLYADSQQSVLIREYQITATYDERGRLLTYNVRPIL